jgi:hypothetical protein
MFLGESPSNNTVVADEANTSTTTISAQRRT